MSGGRVLHELTADQRRLVEAIANVERTRLMVVAPPGTGKTYGVIAGVRELLARVPGARVLVLAPAALSAQFVAMLEDRLHGATPVMHVSGRSYLSLQGNVREGGWESGVYVLSRDLVKRDDVRTSLAASAWDLVIVDEAHALAGSQAELVATLASSGNVRSLVLLAVVPPRDSRLIGLVNVVRWTRKDSRPPERIFGVITYERTPAEQQLYFRLRAFLDSQSHDKFVRDAIERAWRSSISALERVVVRARSRLEIAQGRSGRAAHGSFLDPLLVGAHTVLEQSADRMEAWPDATAASAEMDQLLRHIASLRVDSKLEAALAAVELRRKEVMQVPCVISAMRESAMYLYQALESRLRSAELVAGDRIMRSAAGGEAAGAVLVATDAGLHGLELATDTLLSYDLPRSRLRIEQRWGRVDRVGREQPVTMLALSDVSGVDHVEDELLRFHGFAAAS